MVVWKLKGCPRCGADTYLDKDIDAWYENCLLCGHSREVPRVVTPDRQPSDASVS